MFVMSLLAHEELHALQLVNHSAVIEEQLIRDVERILNTPPRSSAATARKR